jgi:beta-galactosidase/beta-glucuronidase
MEGLDTLATVWFNGHDFGRFENMYRPYRPHWSIPSTGGRAE